MFKFFILIISILLSFKILGFNENKLVKEYNLDCATKKIFPFINPSNSYNIEYYGATKIRNFKYYAYEIKEINKKIICESNYEYSKDIYKDFNLLRVPKNNREAFFYIINNKKTSNN